jgi:hypothetical protein
MKNSFNVRLIVSALVLTLALAAGLHFLQSALGPVAAVAAFAVLMTWNFKPSTTLGAVVAITNIYNPLTFGRRTQQAQTALNRFLRSGVAVEDAALSAQFSQGGNIGDLSNFGALATGEPNYSTDNPATLATPANISAELCKARLAPRNKSWSTMDLARELALQDPVAAITGRIGAYWATDDEQRLIASLLGILADNVANDSGDMVYDIATDSADAVADAERISGTAVINALQTLGDHKQNITTLAIHSAIHARLQKQNLIVYERTANADVMFETYLGKRLIVDDSLPAVAGTNRITYTSILFGAGAVAMGNGRVLVPSEMERVQAAGNGSGQDIIYSRISNTFQPYGFSFISGSVAGQSATYAELKLAANWNRIHARKNIPIAFLETND